MFAHVLCFINYKTLCKCKTILTYILSIPQWPITYSSSFPGARLTRLITSFRVIFLFFWWKGKGFSDTVFISWNSRIWNIRLHQYQAYICLIVLLIAPPCQLGGIEFQTVYGQDLTFGKNKPCFYHYVQLKAVLPSLSLTFLQAGCSQPDVYQDQGGV